MVDGLEGIRLSSRGDILFHKSTCLPRVKYYYEFYVATKNIIENK